MKPIEGYEGLYAITEDGQVWSYISNKFLNKRVQKRDGYELVNLYKDGKQKTFQVHRLVAEAFIPNPENKPTVDHKDRNKLNNCVENLTWATAKEQAMNREHKTTRRTRGKKIVCVETGEIFNSQREAAEKLNLDQGNISRVCRGLLNTCGGYHWKFLEG